jgi:hypothetical protein
MILMSLIIMIQLLRLISYLHNDVKETLNGVHLAPQNGRERDTVCTGNKLHLMMQPALVPGVHIYGSLRQDFVFVCWGLGVGGAG